MLKHFVNQKEVHSVKTKQDQSWGWGDRNHTQENTMITNLSCTALKAVPWYMIHGWVSVYLDFSPWSGNLMVQNTNTRPYTKMASWYFEEYSVDIMGWYSMTQIQKGNGTKKMRCLRNKYTFTNMCFKVITAVDQNMSRKASFQLPSWLFVITLIIIHYF